MTSTARPWPRSRKTISGNSASRRSAIARISWRRARRLARHPLPHPLLIFRRRRPTRLGGERRQVTVLFADISGFTRMTSEQDAEEIHRRLNNYFEAVDGAIRRFGGNIDKNIGDAVMAVFGAPIAHSDDPERAIRAALDMHQAAAELDLPISIHIGIASGQVVAGGTGSATHSEYTVTGESVNLASRLQDQAGPAKP